MADAPNLSQQNSSAQNKPAATGQSDSPWADEVPEVSAPQKSNPTIIGSLDNETVLKKNEPVVFNVPSDLEEKVGQKVPAENYIEPPVNQPAVVNPAGQPIEKNRQDQPVPVNSTAQPIEMKKTVDNITPAPSTQTTPPAKTPAVPLTQEPADANDQIATKIAENALTPPSDQPPIESKKIHFPGLGLLKSVPLLVIFGLLFIGAILTYLTETGSISVGIEKIYGTFGVESLWGGLSKNPQAAVIKSALAMKTQEEYKVKGTLNFIVDKSIKSQITTPLVSVEDKKLIITRAAPIKAIKTALTSDTGTSSYDTSGVSSVPSTSSSSVTEPTTSDSSSASSSDTSSSTSTQSQSDYPSYQYQGSSTKDLSADVVASLSKSGAEASIKLKKITGEYDINLKNRNEKLWVQTAAGIQYSSKATPDKWVEYDFSNLSNKEIQQEFFSFDTGAGMSIKGKRVGNEKIGTERAYHYRIDNLEVGNAFEGLGLRSDMIQSVSGDLWIGIKDKLIKKIELKVTTSPSISITSLNFSLEFYDYGTENTIATPNQALVIKADNTEITAAAPTTPATPSTVPATSTPAVTAPSANSNDEQRKTDLATIKSALQKYKTDQGSFPISTSFTNLNSSNSILASTLVSKYLNPLPPDPKSSDGWYYGYKSDGTTFTLSARFEDTTSKEVTNVGGIYLHYVYND